MEEIKSLLLLFLTKYYRPFLFESLDLYFAEKKLLVGQNKFSVKDELQLLSSNEVCQILKCNRHFLYRLIKDKKILSIQQGGRHMFTSSHVKIYIESISGK